jgi:MSHA biogenesis protein MshI
VEWASPSEGLHPEVRKLRLKGRQALRSFLLRRSKREGLVAVGPRADGVCLAAGRFDPEGSPTLDLCDFLPGTTPGAQQSALAAAVQEHGLKGAACTVVLPPDRYSLRQIDTPEVHPDELREAVRWSIRDLIDFSAADAIIDMFEVPEASGRPAGRIYVVAARKSIVKDVRHLVEPAGLDLRVIEISELALRNIAALLPEDFRGAGLLWAEEGLGMLVMCRDRSLYLARHFDCPLEILAEADAKPEPEAKKPRGRGWLDPEQLLETVFLETQRSLDYYERQLGQGTPEVLYVGPLPAGGDSLTAHLGRNLPIPVRPIELEGLMTSAVPLGIELTSRCLTTIGAALRREGAAP